jgi:hypothetical protein
VGRHIRRRDRLAALATDDEIDDFDAVVKTAVERLHGRFHSLLAAPVLHCQAA